MDFADVSAAIRRATRVARYDSGAARHGGTCWRVLGPDLDEGRDIAIGVEAFLDRKRRRVLLITVFEVKA